MHKTKWQHSKETNQKKISRNEISDDKGVV